MAVVTFPFGADFTLDDLDRFPDDSNRYELIEGSLHVSPSPGMAHQSALLNLFRVLDSACPDDLTVWLAPLDVVFAEGTVLQPDVFVLPADLPHAKRVRVTPLLAAEVLSPSTRSFDLVTKRHVYREAAVGTYLVLDPDDSRVTAWTWNGGQETEQAAVGDQMLAIEQPFPFRLNAADLLD